MIGEANITGGAAAAYTIPTDAPEADGTFAWDSTTLVVVEIDAAGERGFGYTYTQTTAAALARTLIEKQLVGENAFDIPRLFGKLRIAQRNYGREGIAATALSAIDIALWDLKAKLLGVSLCSLLGRTREAVPVYGSGGFTTYSDQQMRDQLGGWVAEGIPRVKMKVGTHPDDDIRRVNRGAGNHRAGYAIVRRCERRVFPRAGARVRREICRVRRELV